MKTMKTCKTGCGKMKSGGKVTAVKKMQTGGKTTYRDINRYGKGIIETKPRVFGKGTKEKEVSYNFGYAGPSGAAITKRKYDKEGVLKKERTRRITPEKVDKYVAENESKVEYKKGGVKKKYQSGGSMITGMPQYPNNPRTYGGRMLQAGGSFAPNRAVQASCKGGMVRDENGRCVMERKMQKGGSLMTKDEYNKIEKTGIDIIKKRPASVNAAAKREAAKKKMQKGGFPDLNKDGKVTKADILKGRGVIKRMGGAKKK